MAKVEFKSVAAYIAAQPKAAQALLRQVRSAIRKALPDAEEVISYQIPTYKLHGRPVIYFAGWAHHYSVYPASAKVVAAFKTDLAPYDVENGTIRFPLAKPVPRNLIAGIAKARAEEVAMGKKPLKTRKR